LHEKKKSAPRAILNNGNTEICFLAKIVAVMASTSRGIKRERVP